MGWNEKSFQQVITNYSPGSNLHILTNQLWNALWHFNYKHFCNNQTLHLYTLQVRGPDLSITVFMFWNETYSKMNLRETEILRRQANIKISEKGVGGWFMGKNKRRGGIKKHNMKYSLSSWKEYNGSARVAFGELFALTHFWLGRKEGSLSS